MPWKNGPPKVPCPTCGEPMYRRGTQCRPCFRASQPHPTCATCGADVSTKTATQCRACWMKDHMAQNSRPKCQKCGVTISWQSGTTASQRKSRAPDHCRPCFNAIRKENRIFVLKELREVENELGIQFSRQDRVAQYQATHFRKLFGRLPCAVCGYNRIACHIHRIVAERGYVLGNVVQVCPNCHGEIHAKLIPAPEPADI